jgi:SagB-type dehydrogenase family enzyme
MLDVYIRLKPRLCLAPSPIGAINLVDGAQTIIAVQDQPLAVVNAMAAMAATGQSAPRLNEQVMESGGVDALLRWQHLLDLCREANAVDYDLRADGETIATAEPLQDGVDAPPVDAPDRPGFVMSRFAYLRREHSRAILESPLSPVRLALFPGAAAAVAQLFACDTGSPEPHSQTSHATMVAVRTALAHWGFLETPNAQESPARRVWEFHDALFHGSSRITMETTSVGATFRFRDHVTPWPALKPSGYEDRLSLVRPDLDALTSTEGSFADVLDRRRSIRDHAATLTVDQLSQFLFRTMRVREVRASGSGETMRRVAPAGGSLHEIDAYLAVGDCDGLRTGCYRYDGSRHELAVVSVEAETVARFLDQATRSWSRRYPKPQVLVTLAARVPRVAWQYERMAYRTVLLNAGVLLQTMYLVATAMRLAPCAVGNGSPALFAALTGLDPFEETSVGEFALSGSVLE